MASQDIFEPGNEEVVMDNPQEEVVMDNHQVEDRETRERGELKRLLMMDLL
ncbi:hypothetical protein J6590_060064 [Homalodisca vitripennis]|nr:hypothetical protein J6590_060064 [Homalodisca vitripennis]